MATVKLTDNTKQVTEAMKRATYRGLTAASLFVEARASENAPVDTGRLRASIANQVYDDHALIGTNVEYAPYVELGTSRQEAQPYLRPALDNNRAKIKAIFANEYDKELK